MTTVAISQFRSELLKFLKLAAKGEEIEVTSRGKAIAKLGPPEDAAQKARQELRKLGSRARVGDIVTPLDDAWAAQS